MKREKNGLFILCSSRVISQIFIKNNSTFLIFRKFKETIKEL